jgi:hypothetical protein
VDEECEDDVQGRRHWGLLGYCFFSLVAVVMGVFLRPRLLSSRSTLFLSSHVFSSVLSLVAGSPALTLLCLCTTQPLLLNTSHNGRELPNGRQCEDIRHVPLS